LHTRVYVRRVVVSNIGATRFRKCFLFYFSSFLFTYVLWFPFRRTISTPHRRSFPTTFLRYSVTKYIYYVPRVYDDGLLYKYLPTSVNTTLQILLCFSFLRYKFYFRLYVFVPKNSIIHCFEARFFLF